MAYRSHRLDEHTIEGEFDFTGNMVPRHAHDWEHQARCDAGSVFLRMFDIMDQTREVTAKLHAGGFIMVPAEWKHELMALENGTRISCVFSKYNADGSERADPSGSHRLEAEGKPWR